MSLSSISSLDNHVSVVDEIEISSIAHSGDDVEGSVNVKSEVFVHLSLGWFTLPLVSIDDIELLVDLTVSGVGNDVSVFIIDSTLDIEDLFLLIGNLKTSSVPHLPPS